MNIIITGGTKGIGRAIAELFASRGWDVAVCARTDRDLKEMHKDWEQRFPESELFTSVANFRRKEEVQAFARQILDHWNSIDVIVNNAGVFIPGDIIEEEDGAMENMIETNLYSAYYFTRALLPRMLEAKKGHIFNMCSIASLKAYPAGGSYSISKYALLGFSQNLRLELQEKGIKVTAIMPGATWSASWAGAPFPEDRLMQANDIALAVWNATQMSPSAVVEEIVIRPQLGDI
jgi:NADP-dependent 3-hydroxy acid dehydrogenase YdfG